jgi:hypothetical protein
MSVIDRLLQRLRIVTKVLLFVVPLVALIAGIGLVGFFTARTLNGHMTVTRETINNLSDFQALRSALQSFIDDPSEATRDALAKEVDDQEEGVKALEALLTRDAAATAPTSRSTSSDKNRARRKPSPRRYFSTRPPIRVLRSGSRNSGCR